MQFTDLVRLIGKEDPAPGLTVSIYEHPVDSTQGMVPAWSYISEGLNRYGQKETVFTILQKLNDDPDLYPRDAIKFLHHMYICAEKGQIIEVGDLTEFRDTCIIGNQFVGLLFLPARQYPAVPFAEDTIAAVAVTKEEIEVARTAGAARVAGSLAEAMKCFPYNTWVDRDRVSTFSAEDLEVMSKEDLAILPVATVLYAAVLREGDHLSLSLTTDGGTALSALLEEVPEEAPFVISTGIDARANACLVWTPAREDKQRAVGPANSDASRMAGSHLAILPGLEKIECGQLNEGFVLMLDLQSWRGMKYAMRTGSEFSLTPKGPIQNFSIHWR